jgi:hypothetical protein
MHHAMERHSPRLDFLAILLVLLAACGETGSSSAGQGKAEGEELRSFTYEETTSGLRKLFEDMMSAIKAGDGDRADALAGTFELKAPQDWFRDTFGDELGAELYREYAPARERLFEITTLLGALQKKGLTRVQVERFTQTGDDSAVGYQSKALERMVKPTALYSVRLQNAEGTEVFHLWSFVYQSGWFRWVGKTRKVAPEPAQGDEDLLEYRLRHAAESPKPRKRKR